MSSTCRSCGAPVVWARTTDGKPMPLNAVPDPAGNVAAHRDPTAVSAYGGALVARVLKAGEEPAPWEVRGTSHFSSCPNADEHRKKKAAART